MSTPLRLSTEWLADVAVTLSSHGIGLVALACLMVPPRQAQGQEIQQRLAEVKQSLAFNKQVLAQYTWMEQQIISIKGEQKKEELCGVRLGPDGKPEKPPFDPNSVSNSDRKERGLRGRIREKKIDEYKEYGDSIKTPIEQYIPRTKTCCSSPTSRST
jgi:hypothetical protein